MVPTSVQSQSREGSKGPLALLVTRALALMTAPLVLCGVAGGPWLASQVTSHPGCCTGLCWVWFSLAVAECLVPGAQEAEAS